MIEFFHQPPGGSATVGRGRLLQGGVREIQRLFKIPRPVLVVFGGLHIRIGVESQFVAYPLLPGDERFPDLERLRVIVAPLVEMSQIAEVPLGRLPA